MLRSLSQISGSIGSCVRFASSLSEASKKLIIRFLSSCQAGKKLRESEAGKKREGAQKEVHRRLGWQTLRRKRHKGR